MTHLTPRQTGDRLIAEQARSQVQTFFDELKNGTKGYRTVADLGAQIAQEYRGRCILELLQNAHDALANAGSEDPRRISFVLSTDPDAVLLVGNSGTPFRHEDFDGICQLAQSPKDPNKSVGNKGLGFRSVLEVCSRPEIWSTAPAGTDVCFSFRFDPIVIKQVVAEAVQDLERRGLHARSPFDRACPLVDWSPEQLIQYRERLAGASIDAGAEARDHLSSYLMPLRAEKTPAAVRCLLEEGHVTVIRLPLDHGDEAVLSVQEQLDAIQDAQSLIFLEHLASLVVEVDGDRCILDRAVESEVSLPGASRNRQRRLRVGTTTMPPSDAATRRFHVWTRAVGGNDDPDGAEDIRAAVEHLPNRWPEVRQATVGLAVEDAQSAAQGVFVIFLPTEKTTGTGTHINAPFYGSLDRREINFNGAYNGLLLQSVLDLCVDAVQWLAAGPPEGWRARAILDILSSTTEVGGETWRLVTKLCERAASRDHPLDDQAVVLGDGGWQPPGKARIMPSLNDDDSIGIGAWREQAGFAVVSKELNCRMDSVRKLIKDLDGEPNPTHFEWVNTIERMAQQVRESSSGPDWNGFLCSLLAILPDNLRHGPDPLANARFLPTSDGRLLSASDSTRLFFPPAQGDENSVLVENVPAVLRERIAFLHPDVQIHEGQQGRNTDVQEFLGRGFTLTFRRRDILEKVIVPAVPSLPVPHGSAEANHCAAVLEWTLKLIGDEPPPPLLRCMPVACHGGWFRMEDASFGPGWSPAGDDAQVLASELPSEAAQQLMETMLLSPDDERWQIVVEGKNQLLASIGVIDGLRLQAIDIDFHMSSSDSNLAENAPAGVPRESWTDWINAVNIRPSFSRRHPYKLTGVLLLPVFHYFAELKAGGRNALSRLVLASLTNWSADWRSVTVKRTTGQDWSRRVCSPLRHWLQTTPWLGEHGENGPQLLPSRWLVPESDLRGQFARYSHLDPLALGLAHELDGNSKLREQLVELGLNIYPTENEIVGPELLDALAKAWADNKVPPGRFDVFLGQVRHGWQHLDPESGLPTSFLVRTGRQRDFSTLGRDELDGVYLPDDPDRERTLREHDKAILEMRVEEARRMAGTLVESTGVRRASLLEERHVIDGAVWDGQQTGVAVLGHTTFDWLPVVLLSVHAHGGNRTGADTDSWRKAADRLRSAHVLECGDISVELVDGGRTIADSNPPAQWLPGDVLVVRRDLTSCKELASATQALLDRQDLLKDLRLVLGALHQDRVTLDRIESALGGAEIDSEALADIRQRWAGTTSLLVDRVRPVVALLGIPARGLDEVGVELERLTEWLSANLRQWPTENLLLAARRSPDDHAMGLAAWRALGGVAQLPAWNKALTALGDRYETVQNHGVSEQTTAHLEDAKALLRGLARHIAVELEEADLFHRIEQETQDFRGNRAWATQWWEVPFDAVLNALYDRYMEVADVKPHLEVLRGPRSVDDFRDGLQRVGVKITPDPYETADENTRQLKDVLTDVLDLHRAWTELRASKGIRLQRPDVEAAPLEYLRPQSDAELLQAALELIDDKEFTEACDGCSTPDEIRQRLNLTAAVVERSRQERRRQEQEEAQKNRTLEVAGMSFEVSGGNYGDLFDHLGNLSVPDGPCASQDEFTLSKVREGGSGGGKGGRNGGRPPPPPPAGHRELVGIVGEIHAYHYLRKEFGEEAVTRDAWVSENRRKVIPPVGDEPNNVDDRHGFDFKFTHKRRKWHVEVKATDGNDSQFELGISEIKAANCLARRGGCWRILRVLNARSDQPEFEWLPNPFEYGRREFYRFHRGGMRVSYSRVPAQ